MNNIKKSITFLFIFIIGIIAFICIMYFNSKFGKVQFSPTTYKIKTIHSLSFSDNTKQDITDFDFIIKDGEETFSLNQYNIKSPFTNNVYKITFPNEIITNVELTSNSASNIQGRAVSGNLLTFTMKNIDFSIRIYKENPAKSNEKEITDNIYTIQKYKNKVYKLINDDYIVITYKEDDIQTSLDSNIIQQYAIEILNEVNITEEPDTLSGIKNIYYFDYKLNIDTIDELLSIGNNKLSFSKDNIIYTYMASKDLSPETSNKYTLQNNYFYYNDNTTTYKSYIINLNNIYHTITLSSSDNFDLDFMKNSNDFFTYVNQSKETQDKELILILNSPENGKELSQEDINSALDTIEK